MRTLRKGPAAAPEVHRSDSILRRTPGGIIAVESSGRFYGHFVPSQAVGNAHSTSSRETKLLQTKGVICAAADYFGPVKVGVCNDDDGEAIRSLEFEFVEV